MKRHTPDQVITKLRQAEADLAQGLSIAQVCQKLGVSELVFDFRSEHLAETLDRMERFAESLR